MIVQMIVWHGRATMLSCCNLYPHLQVTAWRYLYAEAWDRHLIACRRKAKDKDVFEAHIVTAHVRSQESNDIFHRNPPYRFSLLDKGQR